LPLKWFGIYCIKIYENGLDKILGKYNIRDISFFSESSNKIFWGKLYDKKVFIRQMTNNRNNRDRIKFEIDVLKYLSSNNFPCIRLVENIPLIYESNYLFVIFEDIDGIIGWECKNSNYYRACGNLIGQLHSLLDNITLKGKYKIEMAGMESYDFKILQKEIYNNLNKINDKINYGIIHSDLHSGNIIFSNGLYHIIDFGTVNYGYRVIDLLNLAFEINNEGIDVDKNMKLLIEGYLEYSTLGELNEKLIELLILEADISEYEIMKKRKEIDTEYFRKREEKLKNKEPSYRIGRYFA
jgi:Ser/Thr protein kinase RdoA (MazF antagonist)